MYKDYLCKYISKMFPLPAHPFNMQNAGTNTYADWQFDKGRDTIKFYTNIIPEKAMFNNKIVLDVGCGAGGKTLYYASKGVKKIYGLEIIDSYKKDALALAQKKGLSDKFEFVVGDAKNLPFKENFFDLIILNDSMEHVDKPLIVLSQCYKALKPKGKVYVNFPPYYHPYGAHLSDAISFPWIHVIFKDSTLIRVYKDLVKDLPDGNKRISLRISKNSNGKEYFSYINKMTIKHFNQIITKTDFNISYYNEIPLRGIFRPLCKLPLTKECFVKMVVCILEK